MPPKKRKLYVEPPVKEDEATETEAEAEMEPETEAEAVAPEVEARPAVPTVKVCKKCGGPYKTRIENRPEFTGEVLVCVKCGYNEYPL